MSETESTFGHSVQAIASKCEDWRQQKKWNTCGHSAPSSVIMNYLLYFYDETRSREKIF